MQKGCKYDYDERVFDIPVFEMNELVFVDKPALTVSTKK